MRKFTRRQLILTPATILIVAGFLWLVALFLNFDLLGRKSYVWIRLPYHGYRIRLLWDDFGRLQIRTFFGTWHDAIFRNYLNPFTLMISGYFCLFGLIPDQFLRDRAAERIAAGHCRNCNYDLTANTTGICPECGTQGKPSDA